MLAEEKALADAANRTRTWARVKVALGASWDSVCPPSPLSSSSLLWVKYGREPKARFQAEYLRDVPQPSLPPALVGFVLRMGSRSREDATATLLDLVNRGVIEIERVQTVEDGFFGDRTEVSYRLTSQRDKEHGLEDWEKDLLVLVFDDMARDDSFVMSELKDVVKKHRTVVAMGYKQWTAKVKEVGEGRGYLDAKADRMAFAGAAYGFVAASARSAPRPCSASTGGSCSASLVSIVLIGLSRTIKRRSSEAAELFAQYGALKRYMKDFGRMQEKPPDAVVLWEQFLVYAVVFGIADQVVEGHAGAHPRGHPGPGVRTHVLAHVPDARRRLVRLALLADERQLHRVAGGRHLIVLVGVRRRGWVLRRRGRRRRRRRVRRRLSFMAPRPAAERPGFILRR